MAFTAPSHIEGRRRLFARIFNFRVTITKHFSVTENSLTEFRPVWVQTEINPENPA
jgi:hypothetical protein